MTHWVRRFYVAVLSLALLIGPCLSLIGTGAGTAHAHSITTHSGSYGEAAVQSHDHHTAGISNNQVQHLVPENPPLSCEELCEGWAVKKTQRYGLFASSVSSDLDDLDAGINLAISGYDFSSFVDGVRSTIPISDRADISAGPHLYALTNRYRL